jgi:signal transduction histidine kinase
VIESNRGTHQTGLPPALQDDERINILLVDDRPENLVSLMAVLDDPGFRLVKASSGQEALRALLNDDFALILMDVQMPNLDGFETASLIKMRDRTKNIPIIFVTALSKDEPFIYKGYSAGAVDYIFKPFSPQILRSKVSVFADLHRMRQRIQRDAEQLLRQEKLEMEKKAAEQELISLQRERDADQRYRDLVDGIYDGVVWVLDPAGKRFKFVSSQCGRLSGFDSKEWMSNPEFLGQNVPTQDFIDLMDAVERTARSGLDEVIEHRFVQKNGEQLWFKTSLRRASYEHQIEIRGLSVNISQLKLAEESAHNAVKLRDDFLSIASHELKTPLTPLRLQLQLLRRKITLDTSSSSENSGSYFKSVESSVRQVDRLSKLVDELLDVSRINAGQLLILREDFDLKDLIQENLVRFGEEIERAGCTLVSELASGIRGNWDRLRIEQVFVNLLTNAIKYGKGQEIRIHLLLENGSAILSVKDNGIGINEKDQERIFDRFERAVSPSDFGGLGLGLFIVSQILRAHEGTIRVKSAVGAGSEFVVELPLQVLESGTSSEISA